MMAATGSSGTRLHGITFQDTNLNQTKFHNLCQPMTSKVSAGPTSIYTTMQNITSD
jgi:hypothetical protein